MADAVTFSYAGWVALYPEFVAVPQAQAQGYFDLSTTLLRNDGTSPVPTTALQLQLLNLLTAHMAKLFAPASQGGQGAGIVGRIANASEGSVSVQTEYSSQISDSEAFYIQTAYGALYWQMTAAFRQGPRYRVPYSNPAVVPGFPFGTPWGRRY